MGRLTAGQQLRTVRISMDDVRVTSAGAQITRYAFVSHATESSPNNPLSSLDYARDYLEAAGWKCSEIDITTFESNTQQTTVRTLPLTIAPSIEECVRKDEKAAMDGSSSQAMTDWALENCS